MTKANPLGLAVGCFRGVMVWAIIGCGWVEFSGFGDFSARRQRQRTTFSNNGDKTGSGLALQLGKTSSNKVDGGKVRMVGILSIHKTLV
jgi:hypothetical protein